MNIYVYIKVVSGQWCFWELETGEFRLEHSVRETLSLRRGNRRVVVCLIDSSDEHISLSHRDKNWWRFIAECALEMHNTGKDWPDVATCFTRVEIG